MNIPTFTCHIQAIARQFAALGWSLGYSTNGQRVLVTGNQGQRWSFPRDGDSLLLDLEGLLDEAQKEAEAAGQSAPAENGRAER